MIKLTPQKKIISSHYNDVRPELVKRINKVLSKGCIKKGKRKNITVDVTPWMRMFLEYLLVEENLKKLITGEHSELKSIIGAIIAEAPALLDKDEPDFKILSNIFLSHGYGKLNKDEFVFNIGVDTCPYCNRNYTLSAKKRVKPEIDHFFPSSIYPLLAVSFFNLIPACSPCNGIHAKHNKDSYLLKMISPYEVDADDYRFSYTVKSISIINPIAGKSKIDVILRGSSRMASNTSVFHLEALYAMHEDHVLELIIKKRLKYSEKYQKHLSSYRGLSLTRNEIDRMILGNIPEEKRQHERPLSKLYQDIGVELGLIRR